MPSRNPATSVFACPHCGSPLVDSGRSAVCPEGHSFDRAREGFLNLLVGGRLPANSTPGDTAGSLAARRRFLATGAYQPVADAVATALDGVDGPVLDVGCGEGWYLSRVDSVSRHGIDISRKAVQMASRAVPDASFAVASAFRLPVLEGSCAAVFSVFAPHPLGEFNRVLGNDGLWVTATPGPDHLMEMRPAHGTGGRAHERFNRRADPPAGATLSTRVHFALDLTEQTASDLFTMTPLQWQAGAARTEVRRVTVDVWVASAHRDTTLASRS